MWSIKIKGLSWSSTVLFFSKLTVSWISKRYTTIFAICFTYVAANYLLYSTFLEWWNYSFKWRMKINRSSSYFKRRQISDNLPNLIILSMNLNKVKPKMNIMICVSKHTSCRFEKKFKRWVGSKIKYMYGCALKLHF